MKRSTYAWFVAGFFLLVALFFVVDGLHLPLRPLVVALPALYLAVIAFLPRLMCEPWLPLALLLSAAGDFAGGERIFLAQVGFFALGHVAYTVFFAREARFRPLNLIIALPVTATAVWLAITIIPGVAEPTERIFVGLYIVVITAMAVSAVFYGEWGKWWFVAAALLFMLSDSLIAWNKFVARLDADFPWVMATYYAAQLLFAATYLWRFVGRPATTTGGSTPRRVRRPR